MFLRLHITKDTFSLGGCSEIHTNYNLKIYTMSFHNRKMLCSSYGAMRVSKISIIPEFLKYIKRHKELTGHNVIGYEDKGYETNEQSWVTKTGVRRDTVIELMNRGYKKIRDFEMHGSFEELDFDSFDEEELYKRVLKLPKKGSINISFKV
ncbi:MAG: hypothetical protein ACRCYT_06925 [Cetobacterium sp.]